MPLSFWLTLFLCAISFVPSWIDHGEAFREYKSSQGKIRRRWLLKLCLLWLIPAIALVATVITGFEAISDQAEAKMRQKKVEDRQDTLAAQVETSRLTIQAETGDRAALLKLMGNKTGPRRVEAATADYPPNVMNADRILYKFSKSEIEDANARSPCSISLGRPNCIPDDFTNASYIVRSWAAQEVGHMRRYDQIQRLVEIGLTDPDLRVVQAASITLKAMLGQTADVFEFNTRSFVSRPDYVRELFTVNWVGSNREHYDRIPPRVWAQLPGGGWQLTDPISTAVERRGSKWVVVDTAIMAAYSNAGIAVWYPGNSP